MSDNAIVPRFRRGVKFRFDKVREAWILLAPEKLFVPDEIAVEILKLIDGERNISCIVEDLAGRYDASISTIAVDVQTTLENLSKRGAVQL